MPGLNQFGPKSLKVLNKKKDIQKIVKENELMHNKIVNVSSDYAVHKLQQQESRNQLYKKLLVQVSPVRLQPDAHDPLIKKHIRQSLSKQSVSHLRAESQENAVSRT